MAVRVIAGRARGRRLRVPVGGRTRPTSGLVRGALFNMLTHRALLDQARLLDLFAGSGALGIEALSRGAGSVVFVESAPQAVRALRANVAASGFGARAEVVAAPVAGALRRLSLRGDQVDGALIDAPYGAGLAQRTVDAVAGNDLLTGSGWMGVEHSCDESVEPPSGFAVAASRRHGRTVLTLLTRQGGSP
jgi:16S rRNA (guanine966-N2)-methyltransferase